MILTTLVLSVALATAPSPAIDIPGPVHLVSHAVAHGEGGPPRHLVSVDKDFPYADGGVILTFDNGLSLAFPPRYQARERCWSEEKRGWISGCSRMVYKAYHWKRDLIRSTS